MNLHRPELIDAIRNAPSELMAETELGGRWYLAEPLHHALPLLNRAWHAWLVLRGKAYAHEYAETRAKAINMDVSAGLGMNAAPQGCDHRRVTRDDEAAYCDDCGKRLDYDAETRNWK